MIKHPNFTIAPEVRIALDLGAPIVALESTVITHGLPRPQNLELARDMEKQVRASGAIPATVALLDGQIRIGLSDEELVRLSDADSTLKVSHRDFATAIVKKANGGTTVAGTMFAANMAGIKVFATGGIGGVHKESSFDISTDLRSLAEIPTIVVCAGAKAILDLPATLEYLETMGVPVVGYQTDEFPAFYSRESGLGVSVRLELCERDRRVRSSSLELGHERRHPRHESDPRSRCHLRRQNGTDHRQSLRRSHRAGNPRTETHSIFIGSHQRVDKRQIIEGKPRLAVEQRPPRRRNCRGNGQ